MASLASLKRSESEETLLQAAQKAENKAGNVQKFPISRLRPSIQKFQTVLDIDLDRLLKHMHNIDKVRCHLITIFLSVSYFFCLDLYLPSHTLLRVNLIHTLCLYMYRDMGFVHMCRNLNYKE